MKILMYSYGFGKKTTTFIYNEVRYLNEYGYKVKYLTHEYSLPEIFPHEDVEIVEYKPWKILRKIQWILWQKDLSLAAYNPKTSKAITRIISEFKPDIIHCHFAFESIDFIDNYKGDIPIIVHFHGYGASQMLKHTAFRNKIRKVLSKKNVYSIYVSDDMKNRLSSVNINLPRAIKLYYGTDVNFFSRTKQPYRKNEEFTFLQVSSFAKKKGHLITIEAFSKLVKKYNVNARLILGGTGELYEQARGLVEKLGLSSLVEFLGYVDRDKARELMNIADAFVHHSITAESGDKEGIPNAIMEAMSMELPILSTFHAGIPELVEHGTNGFLVEERDVETYTEYMYKIMTWGKLEVNREKVCRDFEYNKHNQRLIKFYQDISRSI